MTELLYPLFSFFETQILAQKIGNLLQARDVVLLRGDLGAGKTALAREIITFLNPQIKSVPSPTFTLSQTYETSKGLLWHYDLFRLKDPEEVFELGVEESFGRGISLIEWPERLGNFRLPSSILDVRLTITGPSAQRQAHLVLSPLWQQRWAH